MQLRERVPCGKTVSLRRQWAMYCTRSERTSAIGCRLREEYARYQLLETAYTRASVIMHLFETKNNLPCNILHFGRQLDQAMTKSFVDRTRNR
jgi:hypothetical protein